MTPLLVISPFFSDSLFQSRYILLSLSPFVAFARSTRTVFQSTLQMVLHPVCHSLISTIILDKCLTNTRLCVSVRFAIEGHHLRQMLDKHAPVCQRKVRHRRPSPWYSSVANQLRELKHERRIAERRWRSSLLIMHKQLYDAAKQKVIDLVRAAKKSFCSIMVSSSATCKELFHNRITLLGKTNPLFLLFYHGVF